MRIAYKLRPFAGIIKKIFLKMNIKINLITEYQNLTGIYRTSNFTNKEK